MKKRIYSIIAMAIILFAGVFASACGDKYKNMEFRVLYAYSQDANEWFDGTDGISLNYSEENYNGVGSDTSLVFNEKGVATLYVKIEVKNISRKSYVDKITVSVNSFSNLNFSSKMVGQDEVFGIQITGNVDTSLKLYENNSGKAGEIPFVVSRELTHVQADLTQKPIMPASVGATMSLTDLDNLLYLPLNETNQIGVEYLISGIGYYDPMGIYAPTINDEAAQGYVQIENNVLRILNNEFYASDAYIVRIKAQSKYYEEGKEDLVTYFDVYVIENNLSAPDLRFEALDGDEVGLEAQIYENGGEKYSTATVVVNKERLLAQSLYGTGLRSFDELSSFEIVVYVLNAQGKYEEYKFDDAEYQNGINGLIVHNSLTDQTLDENEFKFVILDRNVARNKVKFEYALNGFDASFSNFVNPTKEFTVVKGVLPTCITINDSIDLTEDPEESLVVYGTTGASYKGYRLKVEANPNDNIEQVIEWSNARNGLVLSDAQGNPIVGGLLTGSTAYIKFKNDVTDEQILTLKTLNIPKYYNGKDISSTAVKTYITINLKVSKLVTADKFEFISSVDRPESVLDQELVVDAANNGEIYVKAYYTGVNLDGSTVTLTSDNDSLLFGNGTKTIALNDSNATFKYTSTDANGKFDVYAISIKAPQGIVIGEVEISAGDANVGVRKSIYVSSAYLMGQNAAAGLKVLALSSNSKSFTTEQVNNGAFNFAVEKGQYVEFGLEDGDGNTRTINKIAVTSKIVEGANFHKAATNFNVVSNRAFVVDAKIGGKTQVLNVAVSYYALVNGEVKECVKNIEVQIAVYDGIGNISTSITKNIIGYINPYYTETSSTEIEFTTHTNNYATPASIVVFKNGAEEVSVSHASQIEVSINNFSVLNNSNLIDMQFTSEIGQRPVDLMDSNGRKILRDGEVDFLNGKITVALTGYLDLNSIQEISFAICALKFGQESNVVANVVLKIAEIDTAERILVDGENLVSTSDTSKELQLTFINVASGGSAEKDFNASLQFATATPAVNALRFDDIETSLTHLLYRYEFDENGNIKPEPVRTQDDFLTITYSDGKINVLAKKQYGGGLFKLVLATKDSYKLRDEQTDEFIDPNLQVLNEEDFDTTYVITVRVEDGDSTAFTIKTEEELLLINKNLTKNFVLGANLDLSRLEGFSPIGLIGETLNPFEGKFNGSLTTIVGEDEIVSTQYSITMTVNSSARSATYGTIYALFGIVAEGAEISNLKIHASFACKYTNSSTEGLKVAAVAGVNNGTIKNVNVVVKSSLIELSGVSAQDNFVAGSLTFGAIVAVNNATMINPSVDNSQTLTISSNANIVYNIGLIAGENGEQGTITGAYKGKESLNNYAFDVVSNLVVENLAETVNNNYRVGAAVGFNNKGQVSNLLIGGQVKLGRAYDTYHRGSLGGVVGESEEGKINTVTALSLNLSSLANNTIVGGIVGKANKTEIEYVKYISVATKFVNYMVASEIREYTVAGQIHGVNKVAGIVATATAGKITNSSVESFIDTINNEVLGTIGETFYTISNGTVAAGLMAEGSAEIKTSFVKANISTNGALFLTTNKLEHDTYFIGKINKTTYTNKTTYSVVNGKIFKGTTEQTIAWASVMVVDTTISEITTEWANVYYSEDATNFVKANKYESGKIYYQFNVSFWQEFAAGLVSEGTEGLWKTENDYNVVKINGVDLFFPYLTREVDHDSDPTTPDESEPIMIVAPKAIVARVDQKYATDNNSVYVIAFNIDEYEITESVIVNYLNGAGDEGNTHNLISNKNVDKTSKGDGIIDISLLPADAQGLYKFMIIGDGRNYAYINSRNQIVFTGVSGNTPIVIYIYSGFNPDVKAYVAIYTQSLMSSFELESASIYYANQENYEYEINLYSGQSNSVIDFKAENRVKGNNYTTLFEVFGIQQYLDIQTSIALPKGTDESKLDLNAATSNATLKIKEGSVIEGEYYEIITFTVKLKTDYFKTNVAAPVEVATVRLKVNLYNSASSIAVDGDDAEITTSDDISFNVFLTTDYVKEDDYNSVPSRIEQYQISENGEILLQNTDDRDGIKISLDVKEGTQEVDQLLQSNGKSKFAELFDIVVISSLYKTEQELETIGYKYNVSLELKNEFSYRYTTNNIKYNIVVYALSNAEINNRDESMEILMKPTSMTTARIETYAVKTLNVNTDYTDIITNKDVQMSIIEPGSLGNVMMIYLEPAYANITSVSVKTSELFVPALGKKVRMKFTQLVRDERRNAFTTLYGADVPIQDGDTLDLKLISTVGSNGESSYNGVICVYVQLEKFSGLESYMTVELNVTTQNGETFTRTKDLLTTYLPGTYLNYNNEKLIDDGYLIQKGTSDNEVKIKIFGYQFNSNPQPLFKWNLLPEYDAEGNIIEGSYAGGYSYTDDNLGALKQQIKDETGKTYLIGDYVSYYLVKNFDEIEYNVSENSYTLPMIISVNEKIMASFTVGASLKLTTKDGQIAESNPDENKIVFYPTEYIVKSVYVDRLSNERKNIPINHSRTIDLKFTTDNPNNDMTETIYEDLLEYATKDGNLNEAKIGSFFTFYKSGATTSFAEDHSESFEFYMVNDETISIFGVGKFASKINLKIWYGYGDSNGDGIYELKFGQHGEAGITSALEFSFTLNIYIIDEENELPIYSAEEIYNPETGVWDLIEGVNYVLMNDIELERVVPITTAIGRLDGNNRVISIKSFAVNPETSNYGLFAKIGTYTYEDQETEQQKTKQTTLKNVIVDYSEFNGTLALNNNAVTDIVFGGLVGVNDGGIIYNCDVVNLNATKDINFDIIVGENSHVEFGGLVGRNTGIITNSRVGRDSYDRIVATKTIQSVTTKYLGGISWSIYNSEVENSDNNTFEIMAGGLIGNNTGIISTSYVANSNLINYSTNETINITAGFVGSNGGTISYSYVKADEDTLSTTECYSTGYVIEHKGNGIVAGFVYNNTGTVTNCYSNVELKTESAYISGFVYNNNGDISVSYAAATMNSGSTSSNAEQPFVGVNSSGILLSNGKIESSYYLMRSETDNPYYQGGKDVARPLNRENFGNGENLVGFTFILSNVKAEREQGVWSYYTLNSKKRILPELINANVIAHSYRYIVDETALDKVFVSASSYTMGSENNPYTISSVEEFNRVFTENGQSSTNQVGYIRMINNINFNDDETAIKTRSNFILGSDVLSTKTSLEGNGMTISGIYLDAEQVSIDKIGLFGEIKNAYVKNLNLAFATPTTNGQFSTTTAKYSGGLAGKISDSILLNITLRGQSTTLTGSNFVGGLAGMISGRSLVYGIETNLNVKASGTEDGLYYSERDYTALRVSNTSYDTYISKLSYAGGVAGVLDLTARDNIDYNVQFIKIRGDQMSAKTFEGTKEANILAEYAGGVAGYASIETTSFKLSYITGKNESIRGNTAAGGLYGVYLGDIVASQVAAEEDTQYAYDTTMGEYIINLEKGVSSALLNKQTAGNLSLLEGYKNVGGLIGVALNSNIKACYTKVGFVSGERVGGLVGLNVAAQTSYSYSIPYINTYNGYKYVGGLFGSVYGIALVSPDRNSEIGEFEALLNAKNVRSASADVQFTYSTLIVDVNSFTPPSAGSLDYLCPDYVDSNNGSIYLQSNGSTSLTYVYIGKINDGNIVSNISQGTSSTAIMELFELYNTGNPEQTIAFQEVFSGWAIIKYWSLNESKYFPLLKNEMVSNFIDIDSPDDFRLLETNHTGSFRVIDDIRIDMNSYSSSDPQTNWVVKGTFEGLLIGELEHESRRPKVTIVNFNPSLENHTAGFFQRTQNASISGLDIIWEDVASAGQAMNIGAPLGMVSGFICEDDSSLISNIRVTASQTKTVGEEEISDYLINSDSITIGGFGGLVGYATNTNILSGVFAGRVKAPFAANDAKGTCIGGVVGYGETVKKPSTGESGEDLKESEKSRNDKSFVVNSSTFGSNPDIAAGTDDITIPTSSFEISFNASNLSNVNIGGIVGSSNNGAIASCSLGGVDYEEIHKEINITVDVDNLNKNLEIGSIVGIATEGLISKSSAYTKILVVGDANEEINHINIGGLAGSYSIAAGSLASGIKGCNVKSTIKTYEAICVEEDKLEITSWLETKVASGEDIETATSVRISTGVADLSGVATMDQCLLVGEIDTEHSKIASLYVGGAVAVGSGGIQLGEVTTYTNMYVGCNSTKVLYAGGLIGQTGAGQISYSTSWGRIVPITSADATHIYVGGLIGNVNTENILEINNSYSASSIIADSIAPGQIKNLNVGALIGSIKQKSSKVDSKVETTKTYYSSDISLCPDENYIGSTPIGINLGAQTLIYGGDAWHGDLKTEDGTINNLWSSISGGGMPYLTSLRDGLVQYGIIGSDGQYQVGSVMRPKILTTNTDVTFDGAYAFYLLQKGTLAQLPKFNGVLNGVLFGEDLYLSETFELTDAVLNAYDTYSGIIASVTKHSAVSNLHVKLSGEITATQTAGIIAGNNEGVVFNCSVQGNGITLTGSTSSGIGLIVGVNNGFVSHCFSSAEIVETETNVAGIVFSNQNKLMSCYFTGYLAQGNGIVCEVGGASYTYNNYMGGVIKTKAGANKFASNNISRGENNYIDKYSDLMFDVATTGIKAVSTYELMDGSSLLSGKWHYAANSSLMITANNDTTSYKFGYNYNYPVYRFNRYVESNSALILEDYSHQLYTGNGIGEGDSFETREDEGYGNEGNEFTQEDRYKALTKNNTYTINYHHAYKIPHLGILTTVQSLLGVDRNYVVIYDIDGIKRNETEGATDPAYLDWNAIGSDEYIDGFRSTGGFKGVFVTNRYFSKQVIEEEVSSIYESVYEGTDENIICTIQNLKTEGLFANITNAYIADINLGSFHNLKESGALGVNIKSPDDEKDLQGVIVNNVNFNANSVITGLNNITNFYAALFGSIAKDGYDKFGKLTILSFSSATGETPNVKLESEKGIAGLIVGQLSGCLELSEDLGENDLTAWFNGNSYAGGLVGDMKGGSAVKAIDNIINISQTDVDTDDDPDSDKFTTETLGGIAGLVSGAGDAIVDGKIYVMFQGTVGAEGSIIISTNNFGGAVGFVDSGSDLFIRETLGLQINGAKVQFVYDEAQTSFYGLIVGRQLGNVNITSFNFTPEESVPEGTETIVSEPETSTTFSVSVVPTEGESGEYVENSDKFGVGALVGYQGGNLSVTGYEAPLIQLEARGVPNLGGVAGFYSGGTISIGLKGEMRTLFVLIGTTNVGGLYGFCASEINSSNATITNGEEGSEISQSLLNSGFAYSHIIVDGTTEREKNLHKNYGGLFGKWDELSTSATSASIAEESKVLSGIVNYNEISIAYGYDKTATKYEIEGSGLDLDITIKGLLEQSENMASNIGGIAGLMSISTAEKMANMGKIQLLGDESNSTENLYSAKEDDSAYQYCKTINVGGIFGLWEAEENATISDVYNFKDIYGYQNVGGIIGYAADTSLRFTLSNSEAIPDLSSGELKLASETIVQGSDKVVSTAGTVKGAINVGGIIGYAGNGANISNINVRASVYGNTNVGGIVGLAENATIENTYIEYCEISESSQPAMVAEGVMEGGPAVSEDTKYAGIVKGVYYNAIRSNTTGEPVVDSFIPSNVGGFAGALANYDTASISGNTINGVLIQSAPEGGKFSTISTNENCMAEFDIDSTISKVNKSEVKNMFTLIKPIGNKLPNGETKTKANDGVVKYNDIKTGFGGFAGAIDTSVITAGVASNYLNDIDINAQLGINVGAYYGVYKATETNTGEEGTESISSAEENIILAVPKLTAYGTDGNKIKIDGAYNVGGIAGFVNGGAGNYNFDSKTIDGSATILMQSRLTGMYIGALFGKTNADTINAITMSNGGNVKFNINANNSHYIGGIIGRAESANLSSASNMKLTNLNIETGTDSVISSGSNVKNFGGLIGMLKTGYRSGGLSVEVKGTHYNAFTINTIENSNYHEGESRFNQELKNGEVRLYAEAYYLNEDQFDISGSSDTALYDNTDDFNPLNTKAQGWSKQYTGFSKMQKRIIQGDSQSQGENVAEWDAIVNVFDASKITHVGTIKNLGLESSWLPYATPMLRLDLIKEYKLIVDGNGTVFDTEDEWAALTSETANSEYSVRYPQVTDVYGSGNAIDKPIEERIKAYESLNVEKWNPSDKTAIFKDDYISFTVYQQAENDEKLYSAMGIASAQYNQNTEDLNNNGSIDEAKKEDIDGDGNLDANQTYLSVNDAKAAWWQWPLSIFTAERPFQVYYIDCNASSTGSVNKRGLTYFKWGNGSGSWQSHKVISGGSQNLQYTEPKLKSGKTEGSTDPNDYEAGDLKQPVYFVENYMGLGGSTAGAKYLGTNSSVKQRGANFVFDVIYDNASTNGLSGSGATVSGVTDDYVCMSGSLFDVSGIYNDESAKAMQNSDATQWFTIVITIVSVVIDIVVIVATWGVGTGAIAAGKTALKFAGKVGFKAASKIFLKAAGKRFLRQIGKMGVKKLAKLGAKSAIAVITTHTITSMQLSQALQGMATQNFVTPSPYNFGMMNTMYHREVRYENIDGKIQFTGDSGSYHVTDSGATYIFYANSRPKDFHEDIYVATKLNVDKKEGSGDDLKLHVIASADDEGLFEQYKGSDFEEIYHDVTIYDYTDDEGNTIAGGTSGDPTSETTSMIGYSCKGDTAYWQLEKKYEIIDGAYYINAMFANVETYRTTLDFIPEKKADGTDKTQPNYINENGNIYVHGTWNGKEYKYAKKSGSDWVSYDYNAGEGYGDNNLRYDVSTEKYTINNIEYTNVALVEKEKTLKYEAINKITDETALSIYKQDKVLGYDYFEGAYYTSNGFASVADPKDIDTSDGKDSLYKYATFTLLSDEANDDSVIESGWVEGIDYITKPNIWSEPDGDGGTIIHTDNYHYKISSFAGSAETTEWYTGSGKDITPLNSIVVKVYPYSFTDPYNGSAPTGAKDDLFYEYQESGTSGEVVEFSVKYFLYEGGYYVQENIEDFRTQGVPTVPVYVRVTDDRMVSNMSGKQILGVKFDENGDVDYDENGKVKTNSGYTDVSNVTGDTLITYQQILDSYDSYKDYYIPEQNAFVAEIFRVSNGRLYLLNSSYSLGKDDSLLHRVVVTPPKDKYSTNKYEGLYMSNEGVGLYTYYRYKKGGYSDLVGVWNDGYQVVSSGSTTVNNGSPTIFIETAKVILNGSGKTFAVGNNGAAKKQINGSIIIR